ncbi:protein phosphatase 2C domain-containing protein [Escherichia coli]|uniref:Protein phosphatase 2C domain-containing protein n=2 Tax=Enterobacteriaceae TaxID=543 RepID=A0A2W6P8J8_ECOLX|nr:protein phosphatase 2C domain-containing protein [Escherichia coli]
MSWRLVYASAVGTSHISADLPCQDACQMQVAWLNDQQPLLVMFLADGAGSVSQGGEGAKLAVDEAMAFMVQKVQDGELGLNDVLATNMVLTIRQRLFAEAEAKALAVRDFACTFLGLISSANGTLIMQIGDGGVVVDFGRGLELPLTPMVGEYANMTHFISDEDAVSRLETFTSTERAHKVAAFTDGIQRLALNMLDNYNSPHVPFFTPFFIGLAAATQEQLDLLPKLLKQFLSSPAVNERTDDDKTLALALWLP